MLTSRVAGVEEVSPAELEAVVREARRLQRRVLSHAQNSESVRRSAKAGVASVEHAFLADDAALETLLETGTTLVPTLTVTDVWKDLPGLTDAQRERQRRDRAAPSAIVRERDPPRDRRRRRGRTPACVA